MEFWEVFPTASLAVQVYGCIRGLLVPREGEGDNTGEENRETTIWGYDGHAGEKGHQVQPIFLFPANTNVIVTSQAHLSCRKLAWLQLGQVCSGVFRMSIFARSPSYVPLCSTSPPTTTRTASQSSSP